MLMISVVSINIITLYFIKPFILFGFSLICCAFYQKHMTWLFHGQEAFILFSQTVNLKWSFVPGRTSSVECHVDVKVCDTLKRDCLLSFHVRAEGYVLQ